MQNELSHKGKEPTPSSTSQNVRDFYLTSVLRPNVLTDICNEVSGCEVIDINVEKCLCEIADNFIETVIDTASSIAKHKKSDIVTLADVTYALERNFEIYEPSKHSMGISKQKANEIKHSSTADHKRRVELTKEETKNINF